MTTIDDIMALAADYAAAAAGKTGVTMSKRTEPTKPYVPGSLRTAIQAALDEARAAERERISDNVWDAVMDDCENGVKWLNETASEKLMMNYPALWAALGAIRKGDTT